MAKQQNAKKINNNKQSDKGTKSLLQETHKIDNSAKQKNNIQNTKVEKKNINIKEESPSTDKVELSTSTPLKKKKFGVGKIIACILGGIVALIAIAILIMNFVGFKFLIVVSGSMEPTIKVGELIAVKPVEYEELEVGDIVTFKGSSTYFTHRVYSIDSSGIKTKGDANENVDEGYLAKEKVIGITIFHSMALGSIMTFVSANKIGIIAVIVGIGILWLLIPSIIKMWKGTEEEGE